MNKLHRSRYINVVVSMMMAFLMLAAMGTTQVHAAQYTTGTIDPAELKAGDVVYRGVQLTVDRQIVVCKKCNMIWITTGTDYGTDRKSTRLNSSHLEQSRMPSSA